MLNPPKLVPAVNVTFVPTIIGKGALIVATLVVAVVPVTVIAIVGAKFPLDVGAVGLAQTSLVTTYAVRAESPCTPTEPSLR